MAFIPLSKLTNNNFKIYYKLKHIGIKMRSIIANAVEIVAADTESAENIKKANIENFLKSKSIVAKDVPNIRKQDMLYVLHATGFYSALESLDLISEETSEKYKEFFSEQLPVWVKEKEEWEEKIQKTQNKINETQNMIKEIEKIKEKNQTDEQKKYLREANIYIQEALAYVGTSTNKIKKIDREIDYESEKVYTSIATDVANKLGGEHTKDNIFHKFKELIKLHMEVIATLPKDHPAEDKKPKLELSDPGLTLIYQKVNENFDVIETQVVSKTETGLKPEIINSTEDTIKSLSLSGLILALNNPLLQKHISEEKIREKLHDDKSRQKIDSQEWQILLSQKPMLFDELFKKPSLLQRGWKFLSDIFSFVPAPKPFLRNSLTQHDLAELLLADKGDFQIFSNVLGDKTLLNKLVSPGLTGEQATGVLAKTSAVGGEKWFSVLLNNEKFVDVIREDFNKALKSKDAIDSKLIQAVIFTTKKFQTSMTSDRNTVSSSLTDLLSKMAEPDYKVKTQDLVDFNIYLNIYVQEKGAKAALKPCGKFIANNQENNDLMFQFKNFLSKLNPNVANLLYTVKEPILTSSTADSSSPAQPTARDQPNQSKDNSRVNNQEEKISTNSANDKLNNSDKNEGISEGHDCIFSLDEELEEPAKTSADDNHELLASDSINIENSTHVRRSAAMPVPEKPISNSAEPTQIGQFTSWAREENQRTTEQYRNSCAKLNANDSSKSPDEKLRAPSAFEQGIFRREHLPSSKVSSSQNNTPVQIDNSEETESNNHQPSISMGR